MVLKSVIGLILFHSLYQCLTRWDFSKITKISRVLPIFKRKEEVSNYGCISLVALFGKITEPIVHIQMRSFLVSNNALSETQFGILMAMND